MVNNEYNTIEEKKLKQINLTFFCYFRICLTTADKHDKFILRFELKLVVLAALAAFSL